MAVQGEEEQPALSKNCFVCLLLRIVEATKALSFAISWYCSAWKVPGVVSSFMRSIVGAVGTVPVWSLLRGAGRK